MRSRTVGLALTLACCALAAPGAQAAAPESLDTYVATIQPDDIAALEKEGIDLEHALGGRQEGATDLALFPSQAKRLEAAGVALSGGPAPVAARGAKRAAGYVKPETGGDSPSPFYDVYRSYMEPGGIYDEMTKLAADHRDVVKSEIIGRSTLGKPIIALKMTKDARKTPDGTRPAVLYSSNNHAREWIAAETNRRLANWIVDHKSDPKIDELLATTELWFVPIQNVDGYEYTFTCGVGAGTAANQYCAAVTTPTGALQYFDKDATQLAGGNRIWRKTLRDNDADGVYGGSQDGVDPNRNYPAKRAIDEEGAVNQFSGETYRGPFALSEPENLAFDRLLRKVDFKANVNYHSAGQLLLTPVSYTTDYAPVDATIFDAMTGTDGDSAVEPYQPQRSSDLYESNGDTIDNGYVNYGVIGWTPELDQCITAGGPTGCNQFVFPDEEAKVQAVFEKNLPMALNIANSAGRLDHPENLDPDPSQYQVKKTRDIKATPLSVSFGQAQTIEAVTRRSLGPVDVRATITGPTHTGSENARTVTVRAAEFASGERYGEIKGEYFQRVRATLPATFNTQGATQTGDTIAVQVIAGALKQRFSFRVGPLQADPAKKRVLVVQAEDYTGVSPNKTPYDTAPRYGAAYVAALQAAGYEVETYDVDNPPLNAAGAPGIKYPTALGVLSHFDAVVYETGDDYLPQDPTELTPRQLNTPNGTNFAAAGSLQMADWSHHAMLELRDYMNEGGKVIAAGRNAHEPFTPTSTQLTATGNTTWSPDPIEFFNYPVGNTGDDDMAGTAFRRARGISNDTWQNYFGITGRAGGYGVQTGTSAWNGQPVLPKAAGLFDGIGPIAVDATAGNDPNQSSAGAPLPRAKVPTRLRTFSSVSPNEPLRQEKVELDYANAPTTGAAVGGGAAISTADTVAFGFGLEQVDAATRQALLTRSLAYLLPTTPDLVPPNALAFKQPIDTALKNTFDPVEVDVTAADDRGDMKEVRLLADGVLVGTARTFPFQFRYRAPASAAGKDVTLTAQAEDAAGNVSTLDKVISIAAGSGPLEPPEAIGLPTLSGSPVVGQVLTCVQGAFTNQPESVTYSWTAAGKAIAGANATTYTLTAAELGKAVACTTLAKNAGGDVDATSEALTVGPATPAPVVNNPTVTVVTPAPPAPPAAPAPPATTTPAAVRITATVSCRSLAKKLGITCRITPKGLPSGASLKASFRLQGSTASVSRTGKSSFTLTLRTKKAVKAGTKAVVSLTSGSRKGSVNVAAGKSGVRQLG